MKFKRVSCLILALLLMCSVMLPVNVFAEDWDLVEEFYEGEPFFDYGGFDESYIEENYNEEYFIEEDYNEEYFDENDFYFEEEQFIDDAFIEEEAPVLKEEIIADETNEEYVEPVELAVTDTFDAAPFEITEDIGKVYEVAAGETVNIKIVAPGATSYKWQWRTGEGAAWKTLNNSTDTVSFSMLAKYSGRQYQCTVSDGIDTLTSGVATVQVPSSFEITEDIGKVYAVAAGETVNIKIVAPGATSYSWEWRTGEGASWKVLNNTTDTVSFSMLEKYSGRQYQCTVSNGSESLVSGVATVQVPSSFEITEDIGKVYAVAAGETVNIKIVAPGATSYKWQWRTGEGAAWKTLNNSTDTVSFSMLAKYSGRQYQCTVSDGIDTLTSGVATVQVPVDLVIVEDIGNTYSVKEGETVLIKIIAAGATSYKWQWRTGEGAAWKTLNNTTDTVSFSMLEKYSGRQYQCTVSNGTDSKTSGIATVELASIDIQDGDFIFTKLSDTTVSLKKYTGSDTNVKVNETVGNYTVVEIGESAFEGNTTLQSIDLPDTITVIRKAAFKGCTSLSEMK